MCPSAAHESPNAHPFPKHPGHPSPSLLLSGLGHWFIVITSLLLHNLLALGRRLFFASLLGDLGRLGRRLCFGWLDGGCRGRGRFVVGGGVRLACTAGGDVFDMFLEAGEPHTCSGRVEVQSLSDCLEVDLEVCEHRSVASVEDDLHCCSPTSADTGTRTTDWRPAG